MSSLSSMVKGTLTVDPSMIVSGAAAPIVTIDGGVAVSNYPMHWPSPATTAYLAGSVPYNSGNPTAFGVVYNGTTYTPTPATLTVPGTGVTLTINLTLP